MTPEAVLIELLERVGAQHGAPAIIGEYEFSEWPTAALAIMKSQGLLKRVRPARSAVCPGCERACVMPVHMLITDGHEPEAFVVCDKRSDVNRLSVPVSYLEQWQASGNSIATLLSGLLGLYRMETSSTDAARWEVGVIKGRKHSSHLALVAGGKLNLSLSGHSVPLTDVLTLEGDTFKVDRRTLNYLVDRPVAGAGDVESGAQRRERLRKRVQAVKAKGIKPFLKTVAEEERITVSRLKQLLREETSSTKPQRGW